MNITKIAIQLFSVFKYNLHLNHFQLTDDLTCRKKDKIFCFVLYDLFGYVQNKRKKTSVIEKNKTLKLNR